MQLRIQMNGFGIEDSSVMVPVQQEDDSVAEQEVKFKALTFVESPMLPQVQVMVPEEAWEEFLAALQDPEGAKAKAKEKAAEMAKQTAARERIVVPGTPVRQDGPLPTIT